MRIAYFGLGKMGLGPALQLANAGFELHTVVHKNRTGAEALQSKGGIIETSYADALKGADVILSIVPNDAALQELLLNPEVLKEIKEGMLLIEMTSCSAAAMQKVAAAFMERGAKVLDAPVSGGTRAANAGTMTMMCAGSDDAFEEAKPILEVIGRDIFHVSRKIGDGKKIKSLNNLLGAMNKAAAGEVWRIAKENALDPQQVFDVISSSSGNSKGFQQAWPNLLKDDFPLTFTVAHMKKDVDLAVGLKGRLNVPLAETTARYFEAAARENDQVDNTEVSRMELN